MLLDWSISIYLWKIWKRLLALEAKYQIDDRLFDELLSGGTEVY